MMPIPPMMPIPLYGPDGAPLSAAADEGPTMRPEPEPKPKPKPTENGGAGTHTPDGEKPPATRTRGVTLAHARGGAYRCALCDEPQKAADAAAQHWSTRHPQALAAALQERAPHADETELFAWLRSLDAAPKVVDDLHALDANDARETGGIDLRGGIALGVELVRHVRELGEEVAALRRRVDKLAKRAKRAKKGRST